MKTIEEIRRENLRELANRVGSISALAEKCGVAQAQMSSWVNGLKDSKTGKQRGIRTQSVQLIEEKIGLPPGWINKDHKQESDIRKILESMYVVNFLSENTTILTDVKVGNKSFAIRINNDSMEPEFYPGDVTIIDPDVIPLPGDFVVASVIGAEEIKLFRRYSQPEIGVEELIPLNPYFPSIKNITIPFMIEGTAVEHRRYRKK